MIEHIILWKSYLLEETAEYIMFTIQNDKNMWYDKEKEILF